MNEKIRLLIQAMKSFCDGASLAYASDNRGISSAFQTVSMQLVELTAELQNGDQNE